MGGTGVGTWGERGGGGGGLCTFIPALEISYLVNY